MPEALITAVEVAHVRSPLPVNQLRAMGNETPRVRSVPHRGRRWARGTAFAYTRDGPLALCVSTIAPQ